MLQILSPEETQFTVYLILSFNRFFLNEQCHKTDRVKHLAVDALGQVTVAAAFWEYSADYENIAYSLFMVAQELLPGIIL